MLSAREQAPNMASQANNLPGQDWSDAGLVAAVLQGDQRAFGVLYRRHARYLAGVVHRLMGDASEVEDVVQETFVAATKGLHRLRDGELVRSWLVTVAVRNVNKRLRARTRRRWLGQEVARAEMSIYDPEARRAADELYDVLDRLSPKLRIPWILVKLEGHKQHEAAQVCGVSLATLKRRLADADQRVEARLS